MGIFGRRRAKQEPALEVDELDPDELDTEFEGEELEGEELEGEELEDAELEDAELDDAPLEHAPLEDDEDDEHEMEWSHSRVRGPFDRSEVDSDEGYLDLGGLWVPAVEGMQLRLEIDEQSQTILGAQVVFEPSTIQLQAYAAPRTMGVWREIRTEIGQGVLAQGGKVEVSHGPFGKQLTATLKGGVRMRFLGVDGPRWFLRGVLSGPAATDDAAAEKLVEVMRQVVVVRGSEAMAPRELLPMRMPTVPEDPDRHADGTDGTDGTDGRDGTDGDDDEGRSADGPQPGARRVDDLKPFQRGPEITEVR